MNKNQEKIAIELIEFIKSNNGFVNSNEIIKNVEGLNDIKNDFVIIESLIELKLLKKVGDSSFMLTYSGSKFKSFKKLNKKPIISDRLWDIIKIIITALISGASGYLLAIINC
jgi:hypothetical protein